MSDAPAHPPARGRPRSADADAAIVRATLEALAEDGYRALSIEDVARRAAVGKATIYRRHRSKEELVAAAVRHVHADFDVPEDTGAFVTDFAAIARQAVGSLGATEGLTFMPRMLAEAARDPEMHAIFTEHLVTPRRTVVQAILERAIARGELRDDLDLEVAVDVIAGPMIYRVLLGGLELHELQARSAAVLTTVLDGLRPR